MPFSRRDFIRTMIVSSGAMLTSWNDVLAMRTTGRIPAGVGTLNHKTAHMLFRDKGAMPAFAAVTRTVDTVIIGAGMSGLAAAWRLKHEHKEFLILENEPSIGGVMKFPVPSWHGIPYPLGSTYFYRYDGLYKRFYHDIGVTPFETPEDALYIGNGEAVVDWWNPAVIAKLPYSTNDRDAFREFRERLLVMPVPTYPLSRASLDVVREYDSQSGKTWVDQFGSQVLSDKMNSYAMSVLGAPLAEINAYSLLNFYSLEFGLAFDLPCHTFAGGLGEIVQRAQDYLGADRMQPNALVVSVENVAGGGVLVQYIDTVTGEGKSIKAKAAIVAVQKRIASQIVRGIPTAQAAAMEKIRYAPYVTIALCCKAPLFKLRAFDFWFSDAQNRFTDIIDVTSTTDIVNGQSGRTEGDFVYMLSSPRPESDRAHILDEAWLAEFAQATALAVEENIPGAMDKIVEMHVFAWGHSMVIPAVGSHQLLYQTSSASTGKIHFANADNDLAPGVENALWWGVESAERVLEPR